MIIVDGFEENLSKFLSIFFVEDFQYRLKWIVYLEFIYNNEVGDLIWDKVYVYYDCNEMLYLYSK